MEIDWNPFLLFKLGPITLYYSLMFVIAVWFEQWRKYILIEISLEKIRFIIYIYLFNN
jgi:hypothetical protein